MAAKKKAAGNRGNESNGNGANLGFEQKLWLAADKLRSNMDASEYKHTVLGLIFLKYIADAFELALGSCAGRRNPYAPTVVAIAYSSTGLIHCHFEHQPDFQVPFPLNGRYNRARLRVAVVANRA